MEEAGGGVATGPRSGGKRRVWKRTSRNGIGGRRPLSYVGRGHVGNPFLCWRRRSTFININNLALLAENFASLDKRPEILL